MAGGRYIFCGPCRLFLGVPIALVPVWDLCSSRARGLSFPKGVADHGLDRGVLLLTAAHQEALSSPHYPLLAAGPAGPTKPP